MLHLKLAKLHHSRGVRVICANCRNIPSRFSMPVCVCWGGNHHPHFTQPVEITNFRNPTTEERLLGSRHACQRPLIKACGEDDEDEEE